MLNRKVEDVHPKMGEKYTDRKELKMAQDNVIDIGKKKKGTVKIVLCIAAVLIAVIAIISAIRIVPAGCTGVVTTFGEVSDTSLTEGLHFVIPFAQKVEIISNKIQIYEATADAVSNDMQAVSTKIAVNYRIQSEASARIFREIGVDYKDVILMPTVQEGMKSVCAKYNAEQLITKRASVADEIKTELAAKVSEYGIEIEKFNIVNFDFSIVVAEAEAKKKVIAAEADAKAIKARADAQAAANKTIAESLSPTLIQYQTIERWNGVLPKVASSANPLISLDLDDEAKTNSSSSNQQQTQQKAAQ